MTRFGLGSWVVQVVVTPVAYCTDTRAPGSAALMAACQCPTLAGSGVDDRNRNQERIDVENRRTERMSHETLLPASLRCLSTQP